MRKKFKFSILELSVIIIVSCLTVLLLSKVPGFVSMINSLNENEINSYLNVIGNISGGFIGGIVAYFVAAYQVSNVREHDLQRSLKESYAALYLLLDEVTHNHIVVERTSLVKEDINKKAEHLLKQLFTNQWENMNPAVAQHIESDTFKNICDLYRRIQLIKLNSASVNEEFIATLKKITEMVKNDLTKEIDGITQKIESGK